jgi:hypothetical protein
VLEPSSDPIWICGTSGSYDVSGTYYRDTDWYEINLDHETTVTFECMAMFPVRSGIIDGRDGCDVNEFYSTTTGYECDILSLTETLPPGTWWLWVGPQWFDYIGCDSDYLLMVDGYTATTVAESASWSTIKALYRREGAP